MPTIADLVSFEHDVVNRLQQARTPAELTALRSSVFGKTGSLKQLMQQLAELPEADRPQAGQAINQVKQKLDSLFKQSMAANKQSPKKLLHAYQDVTLPGRRMPFGAAHPLRIVEADMLACLVALGFEVAHGPQIEHDWYNFEALNIPAFHPARDMQDTFFVAPQVVLRTHTSNVQIRTMLSQSPPVRIVASGMVYRHDEVDATHSPAFHQLEGLWVDDKATFADCKGVIHRLTAHLFGPDTVVRLRPSYFPFTEPSVEADVRCWECQALPRSHCRICRGSGWIEILGAGMVDPAVFQAVGYDADKLQGFAFGIGLERVAMLRFGIDDIRLLYDNDVRFLSQLGSSMACS